MSAVWLRFRAELRRWWRAWTAYDRFLRHQRAFDVQASVECPRTEPSASVAPACEPMTPKRLVGLPQVTDAAPVSQVPAEIETADGRGVQPDPEEKGYTGLGEVLLFAAPDGRFWTAINRVKVLKGELPTPSGPKRPPSASRWRTGSACTPETAFTHRCVAPCRSPMGARICERRSRFVSSGWSSVRASSSRRSGLYLSPVYLTPTFARLARAFRLPRERREGYSTLHHRIQHHVYDSPPGDPDHRAQLLGSARVRAHGGSA